MLSARLTGFGEASTHLRFQDPEQKLGSGTEVVEEGQK